ncbi:MAG: UDP-4-amino-4,6-dideoxy-N-acetyl-beta-L-altrosamine transaminase [Lentisphaerae bacterium GWF2_57_35]|nr:MAG: UDP-4-amino-4,6-dideoxy-N-acetyl-beta-L-altrosamine transaminase [Lentisphaerae bacterium GWF2_57_35]
MIPYGKQTITEDDIEAVVSVLRSDWLTQGPAIPRFEQSVADRMGVHYAVAVNSATSALHIACLALGLRSGERLWTVPNTFVASANCALYCGAMIDFVDIDPVTWNMSIQKLADKLVQAKRENKLPKVIVPVHFAGQPVEQEAIWELAKEYGFHVLEDASHAVGACRHGEPVGSCRWSDITVFSFHPVKIITTGEGGMALTNDADLAWRMEMLRSHGITRDPGRMIRKSDGPWYYEQQMLGFNYRMTDLQAALGLSQIMRLNQFVNRRNELAARYSALLNGLPLQLPVVSPGNQSAFHLYVVLLANDHVHHHRHVFDYLRAQAINVNLHYMPVHLQPYYRERGFGEGLFPVAEAHGKASITLPLFPRMTECEQDHVVKTLMTFFKEIIS